jgi:two-component system cell cycle response regulator
MTARILVVDDIATNLRLLEVKLQAEYYEVALAGSGAEALALARTWSPDVVLLDVMMPGMDGYEVCRRLKGDPATVHIPVVMVTALADQSERVRGLEAGADDFLSKPVDDATLFARLRALLRVKQVQDAWRRGVAAVQELGIEAPCDPALDLGGARALVVGGDAGEAARIQAALAADGLSARRAAEPEHALRLLSEGGFDLALLCLAAEGGETLRLASRLRAQATTRDLPVLLVADPDQRRLVLRGFDLGVSDHLFRPLDLHELRARVRNQIRRKRYQDGMRDILDRSLKMAVTDQLTGLRNRHYASRYLEQLLRGSDAAVLLLDVDRFKAVNDSFGHDTGDAVLREVARRLQAQLRGADVVARYGGEEFLVALAAESADYAVMVAERLRQAISSEPCLVGPLSIAVSASIGLAIAPIGTPVAAAIGAADAALYRAKARGRDCVVMATAADLVPQPA